MSRTALITLTLALVACTPEETPDGTPTPVDPPVGNDIVDIASGDEQFSTLTAAIIDAGLEDTLRGDGPFTVFAPTDAAFAELGIDLSTLSTEDLSTILQYHVVAGEVDSTMIPARADSVADYTLFFDTSSGVMVNDATVSTADVEADNGLIHVVDKVLLPPTILDAAGYAGLTELAGAVGAADPAVADLLGAPGQWTVFAPDNAAFEAIADTTATLDQTALTDVLTYHVVEGAVTSDIVPDRAPTLLANEWGNDVTAVFSTDNGVFVNGSEVIVADIKTTNGVVHVVDGVLLPPNVVDLAVYSGLTGLLDTVGAASGDLGTVLSGTGPFTVFAPTNEAFADISDVAATLTADELRDILLFHVVGGPAPVASTDLSDGEVPTLLDEQSVTIDLTSGVKVEDAFVEIADFHGTNGTVHVIDSVMLPPGELMAESSPPNVFQYLDAREFLRAYYTFKKETTTSFSYRAFSRRAGLKSPNYLKLVIDGDRNLTSQTAHRFGQALGLEGQRLAYFLDLVAFTQARTTDERAARYEKLIRFREHREIHKIDIAYGQYHSHWFIPAIRELTFRPDCQDDPAWVAERLLPPIREKQAADAIELLVDLELIERVDGLLKPTESLVSTGPEVKGIHYVQYHRMMMQRAAASLELPSAERDISSVTLCLDDTGIARLKEVLGGFRRQLLQLSAAEDAPTQVVQVNLQLFPLTRPDTPES